MSTQTTSSVSERALLLLEIIAKAETPLKLNELMTAIGLPKATTHRFVALLEELEFVQRTGDGRRFEIGHRLTSMALDAMRHAFQFAPRRVLLSALVRETGETCNVTMLDGDHLIYLDRVESDWPLQFRLKIGSHVPLHCTASGKLFLALGPPSLRKAVLRTQPLQRYTPQTLTTAAKLEPELDTIRKTGIGTDQEEFMDGMTAAAVPVCDAKGRIFATVAVHGPNTRLPLSRAISLAPALKRVARAIEQTLLNPNSPAGHETTARQATKAAT